MLPDGGNDLLTWCSHCQILVSHVHSCAICVSTWLSVSSAHSGRRLGRPGRSAPRWRNAKAKKQETIFFNNLQTWNTFQKIQHSATQLFKLKLPATEEIIPLTFRMHGLIYHWKRHQTTLWFFSPPNHIWLFHDDDVQIIRFYSVYYDVETTIVAITGFVSTQHTTMLKQQS